MAESKSRDLLAALREELAQRQQLVDATGHVHRVLKFLVGNAQGHSHDLTVKH